MGAVLKTANMAANVGVTLTPNIQAAVVPIFEAVAVEAVVVAQVARTAPSVATVFHP